MIPCECSPIFSKSSTDQSLWIMYVPYSSSGCLPCFLSALSGSPLSPPLPHNESLSCEPRAMITLISSWASVCEHSMQWFMCDDDDWTVFSVITEQHEGCGDHSWESFIVILICKHTESWSSTWTPFCSAFRSALMFPSRAARINFFPMDSVCPGCIRNLGKLRNPMSKVVVPVAVNGEASPPQPPSWSPRFVEPVSQNDDQSSKKTIQVAFNEQAIADLNKFHQFG